MKKISRVQKHQLQTDIHMYMSKLGQQKPFF